MVINESFLLCPWADYLYAADHRWWDYYAEEVVKKFQGESYTVSERAIEHPPYPKYLKWENKEDSGGGLCPEKGKVYAGGHGGHQAASLAYQLGYDRIVLLGFDMKPGYWFGDSIRPAHLRVEQSYPHFANTMKTLHDELLEHGVILYNCTPGSLMDIPYTDLESVL
jgi:hypothetical protein